MTNAFDTIGWGDDFSGAVRLPFQTLVLRALNGDGKLKGVIPDARYFGGWAYGADNVKGLIDSGDFEIDPSWPSYEMDGDKGPYNEAANRVAHLAVIKGRMRWHNSNDNSFAMSYFTGARMHVQYLAGMFVVDKGKPAYAGMATLTAKGMQAKHLQDAISAWENAIRAAKAGTPEGKLSRPCWILTIGTKGDKPEVVMVGKTQQSPITPLRAILPQKEEEYAKRIVPEHIRELLASRFEAATEWLNAWKSAKPSAAAEPLPEPADMVDERPF